MKFTIPVCRACIHGLPQSFLEVKFSSREQQGALLLAASQPKSSPKIHQRGLLSFLLRDRGGRQMTSSPSLLDFRFGTSI